MPTPFFADLVRETCQEGGTGPLTPTGAVPGHRRFADAVPADTAFHYAIAGVAQPAQWETGLGRIDNAGRLIRDSVAASSNAGLPVSFAPGLKTIALTVGADWFTAGAAADVALADALATKQPLSTSHPSAASAVAGDMVTVRRGGGWTNIPIAPLKIAEASGTAIKVSRTSNAGACLIEWATGSETQFWIGQVPWIGAGNEFGIWNQAALSFALRFAADSTLYFGGPLIPTVDNGFNLGYAGGRLGTIFAGTGAINTSDARDKIWRGTPNAAELRAASRIARDLGFYRWTDAVAHKGEDGARYHFGVRAQAVWAIMADEGLIDPLDADGRPGATPYAFLCWDAWQDENGAARDRFGIRPDQLGLFLAAAQEARLVALEAAA